MPADHLLRNGFYDVAERKRALLLSDARVIDDLQKKITELVLQVDKISPGNRVRDLVGLLDRIGRNCLEALFEIPRAACLGRPERRHDLYQPADIARWYERVRHVRPLSIGAGH